MGAKAYNEQISPTAVFTSCFEQYEKALEVLACRMLGEPYNAHRVEAAIIPAMLGGGFFGQVISECQKQYQQQRRYTPGTVADALKVKQQTLFSYSMQHTEIDLPFAFSLFADQYGRFVEAQVADYVGGWLLQGMGADEILVRADKMRREKGISTPINVSDGKAEFEAELLAALDGKVLDFPIKPTIAKLRKMIPYHEPGDYVIVAGRTGMGKSFMALNYIYEAAVNGIPVTYINLENTQKNVQKRIWQMHSRKQWQPNLSHFTADDIGNALEQWEEVKKMPFTSIATGRNLQTILNAIRQEYYERGIQLAVIDYIQLMRERAYSGNRVNELGEISAEVRALCLELQIPLIALAQISREGEKSGDSRPGLSHLRGSGDLEQDAATVMLLYRPEYYNIFENEKGEVYPPGYAEIIVAKGRETGNAIAECRFDPIRGYHDAEPEFATMPGTKDFTIPQSAISAARLEEEVPF